MTDHSGYWSCESDIYYSLTASWDGTYEDYWGGKQGYLNTDFTCTANVD